MLCLYRELRFVRSICQARTGKDGRSVTERLAASSGCRRVSPCSSARNVIPTIRDDARGSRRRGNNNEEAQEEQQRKKEEEEQEKEQEQDGDDDEKKEFARPPIRRRRCGERPGPLAVQQGCSCIP